MVWLQDDCPIDLLPLILAFAGPQTMSALARTNRFWNEIIQKESTWKTVCEELYKVRNMFQIVPFCVFSFELLDTWLFVSRFHMKLIKLFGLKFVQWKEGDPIPSNWKDFYKYTPSVPTDYSTVNQALAVVRTARAEQVRSIRILLRPGRYVIRESILVQAPSSVRVQIETMNMPDSFQPITETSEEAEPPKRRNKGAARIRSYLSCRSVDDVIETEPEEDIPLDFEENPSSSTPAATSAACGVRR